MKQRRVGKIIILYRAIDSTVTEAMFVWLRFVPMRVELLEDTDEFYCIGISHAFDLLDYGCLAPEYRIKISAGEAGDCGHTFKAVRL